MTEIAHSGTAPTDQGTEGQVEMPRLTDKRNQDHTCTRHHRTEWDNEARPKAVHQYPNQWSVHSRTEKAERKRSGGAAPVPAKLRQNRGE